MPLHDIVYTICDILGTIAFAISGAMVACRKQTDLFGNVFLAEITALGGGMMRDILLGQFPPALFTNYTALILAFIMALLVFFTIHFHREFYDREVETVEQINNMVDALALGLFAATGCQVTISAGYGEQAVLVIAMGTLSAVGGGLLRDMILREIPFIFTKHVYALAAMAGAAAYYALYVLGVEDYLACAVSIVLTFTLRWLATTYRWNLPRP